MGRIFEVRKAKMFARWSKNSKAFTKIGKEIAVAIKLGGANPASNTRLKVAIKTARALNMPKDSIDNAIKRASSKDATNVEELVYEGYGPHGVAILVEAATDNPTRTVANVRSIFGKNGGNLGSNGSVEFMFSRKGTITIDPPAGDMDEFELEMIDHGLEDIFQTEEGLVLYSQFEDFNQLQKAIEAKGIEIKSAAIQRFPTTTVELTAEQEAEIEKLVSSLEEDDDVQHVYDTMKRAE